MKMRAVIVPLNKFKDFWRALPGVLRDSSVFLFFSLLSFRKIFLLDRDFIPGHNWDWTFPNFAQHFSRITDLSYYTWWNYNLGIPLNLTLVHLVPNTLMSLAGQVLGYSLAIKLFLFAVPLGSFLSFRFLVSYLSGVKNSSYSMWASFLYGLSPFLFNEMVGGSWYMWISYAAAPLFFVYMDRFIKNGNIIYIAGYLISSIFVISSIQNFVLVCLIYFCFFVYRRSFGGASVSFMTTLLRYAGLHLILFFFNLFWIVPFVHSFLAFAQNVILEPTLVGGFESVRQATHSLWAIGSIVGYYNRNMYFYAIPSWLVLPFVLSVGGIWAGALIRCARPSLVHRGVIFWLALLSISVLVVKGGNPPFADFTMKLFQNFKFMALYRSPQHLIFLASFIIPIFLSLIYTRVDAPKFQNQSSSLIFGLGILLWTSGWWVNGDIGQRILLKKNRDHIDFFSLSPQIRDYYNRNESSQLNHRAFFLPAVYSPLYKKSDYQNKAQGGIPEYMYLKNPTFNSESNLFAHQVERSISQGEKERALRVLRFFSVRDIVLRKDISAHFTEAGAFWDETEVRSILKSSPLLELPPSSPQIPYVFKFRSEEFLPLVFTPTEIVETSNPVESLLRSHTVGGLNIRQIFFQRKKGLRVVGENGVHVEYRKINAIKYRVRIHNAERSFPLVLNENFNSNWKLFPGTTMEKEKQLRKIGEWKRSDFDEDQASLSQVQEFLDKGWISSLGVTGETMEFISKKFQDTIQNNNLPLGSIGETWFKRSLNEFDHFRVNGFANAWMMDSEKFCDLFPNACFVNSKGIREIEIVLEYWPQRLFVLGLMMAMAFIVLLIVYFIGPFSFLDPIVLVRKKSYEIPAD